MKKEREVRYPIQNSYVKAQTQTRLRLHVGYKPWEAKLDLKLGMFMARPGRAPPTLGQPWAKILN